MRSRLAAGQDAKTPSKAKSRNDFEVRLLECFSTFLVSWRLTNFSQFEGGRNEKNRSHYPSQRPEGRVGSLEESGLSRGDRDRGLGARQTERDNRILPD